MSGSDDRDRTFLFLQGMASGFLSRLGQELSARGRTVHRINFNGGDRLFWAMPGASDYRGGLAGWPDYLTRKLKAWSITDIVLFGDARPLHAAAIAVAQRMGVRVHVVEEGYLRPNWITLEADGVNRNSALPRDPKWYLTAAQRTQRWGGERPVVNDFGLRARQDVAYNVAALVMSPLYPGYRTHRPWHPLVEYIGWVSLLLAKRVNRRRSRATVQRLRESEKPFFVFALQLDCDTQIRLHSAFGRVRPSIEFVIASFAATAPKEAILVVKEHPLDNGLTSWRRITRAAARRSGIAHRVLYIEDAPLEPLLEGASGLVSVNSTAGVLALSRGVPTKTLGPAIYDLPGLTFPGSLDAFWTDGQQPDANLFDAFRRVVAQHTQINGGFFSRAGLKLAVSGAADKLERDADIGDRRLREAPRLQAVS